jgi:hypothetical protein
MYHLAVTAHTNNWSSEQVRQQREELIVRNHDLVDEKARETARREFDDIVNPGLAGALPAIHALTEKIMFLQPAGGSKRFQHEFLKICRRAKKVGVAAALRDPR